MTMNQDKYEATRRPAFQAVTDAELALAQVKHTAATNQQNRGGTLSPDEWRDTHVDQLAVAEAELVLAQARRDFRAIMLTLAQEEVP
jgi:hypothetical protein